MYWELNNTFLTCRPKKKSNGKLESNLNRMKIKTFTRCSKVVLRGKCIALIATRREKSSQSNENTLKTRKKKKKQEKGEQIKTKERRRKEVIK